nr:DHHW family protein [Sedimentibacter sp.]
MLIAKNIKFLCVVIVIFLSFTAMILYGIRNSTDKDLISAIENESANKISNIDEKKETSDDEIDLIDREVNEIADNDETDVTIKEKESDKFEESEGTVNHEKSKELENDISSNSVDVIGNDLPIEHPPENEGSFVIINSVGYEKFMFSKYNANIYVESINNYAENLNDGIKIYSLIAPTSSEFNMPDGYRDLSGSQKEGIDYAYAKMDDKIITIDAYSNIEANKEEYLYFKTDHHWTALGAYRAYEAFMKVKCEEAVPLESYSKIDSKNKYLGSIYNMTKNERLENNLDDIWYYKPLLPVDYSSINRDGTTWDSSQIIFPSYFEHDRKYSAFMGGDTAFSHIKVDSSIEKKILVIKDSYGNAFIPFLLPHYSDIFVADPRYFTNNIYDVIQDNKIDEVLIINYATVLQLPVYSQMLGDMGAAGTTSETAIKANIPLSN